MSNEIIKMLAQLEKNNLNPVNNSPTLSSIDALEVNNILKLLECPEIAIDKNDDEQGSNLFIASYYMILQLATRIETLEKQIKG